MNERKRQDGFLMPTVVIVFGVSLIILLAIFQYVTTTVTLTSQVVYQQISLTAARGALDFGKEQFDSNASYPGTAETEMFHNDTYKVTYELVKVSQDGREMRVQGIGRVYLPADATSARYSRTINGEIIRSQITAGDPLDFSPMAWYDASCNDNTSSEAICQNNTVLKSGTNSAAGNPTSLREEQENGNFCGGAPDTGDNNLALPTGGECGGNPPSSNNPKQRVGLVFNLGTQLPKGVALTDARIQFTSAVKDTANIVLRVKGIDVDNVANFTNSSSAQINGAATTDASVTWDPASWNSPNQSSSAQRTADIKSIIQEIIDRPGWNTGNNIGIFIEYQSGPGARRAKMAPITLTVTYTGASRADTGDSVQTWRDRSGNGLDLTSQSGIGNWPIKGTVSVTPVSAAPNGKPMILFQSGHSYMTATVPASSGRVANTYTAFAVMRVKSGTTTDNNASLVGFYGSGTGNVRYSPFLRASNGSDICIARSTTQRLCNSYGSSIATSPQHWTIWSAREALTERDMQMRRNGHNPSIGQSQFYDPVTLSAPYQIVLGADAQNLTPNSDVEFAEVILYDTMLPCPQIESVEQYLAQKWGYTDTSLSATDIYSSDGCTENTIPAY